MPSLKALVIRLEWYYPAQVLTSRSKYVFRNAKERKALVSLLDNKHVDFNSRGNFNRMQINDTLPATTA